MDNGAFRFGMAYWPLGLTGLLIIWTIAISPYSRYGDYWAIVPALAVFPLTAGMHLVLLIKGRWRTTLVLYAIAHLVGLFAIWLLCLMRLSKDSL